MQDDFTTSLLKSVFGRIPKSIKDDPLSIDPFKLREILEQNENSVNTPLSSFQLTLTNLAAIRGSVELFEIVSDFNPNPNLINIFSDSPLIMAAKELTRHDGAKNYIDVIHAFLLIPGVNSTYKNKFKLTAKTVIRNWIEQLKQTPETNAEKISLAEDILASYEIHQFTGEFFKMLKSFYKQGLDISFVEFYNNYRVALVNLSKWDQATQIESYLADESNIFYSTIFTFIYNLYNDIDRIKTLKTLDVLNYLYANSPAITKEKIVEIQQYLQMILTPDFQTKSTESAAAIDTSHSNTSDEIIDRWCQFSSATRYEGASDKWA